MKSLTLLQANQIVDCIQCQNHNNELSILGILGVGDLTFGVGYPPLPPFCMKHWPWRLNANGMIELKEEEVHC